MFQIKRAVHKPILKRTTRVRLNIGWSVLAFLELVISLICLLLGRTYRTFLINTLCNLFYDFAAGIPVCHMSAPARYIGTGGIRMVYAGPVYTLIPIWVYIILSLAFTRRTRFSPMLIQ